MRQSFSYREHFKKRLFFYGRVFKRGGFWLTGALVAVAFLTTIGAFGFEAAFEGKIYPGVKVEGLETGGKTVMEARQVLEKEFGFKKPGELTLRQEGKIWLIDLQKLNFRFDKETTIKEAMDIGRQGNFFNRWGRRLEAATTGIKLRPFYVWNGDYLGELTAYLEKEINKEAVEAKFRFDPARKRVMEFRPSENGQKLATKKLFEALQKLLRENREEDKKLTLEVPVETLAPKITTTEANDLGIEELLGRGESFFAGSSSFRRFNIRLAAERVNGTLVAPGELFSFNESLGEVSSFTGFKKELVIKEGELILEDGGGVCQVSTTLFRAVLNSGLAVRERRNHSFRINYYEQGGFGPGLDATVYPGVVDFKFRNNTESHVLVQAIFEEAPRHLVFELYGKRDGRRTRLEGPVIVSSTPPPPPIYQADPNLPPGEEKILEKAIPGAKVFLTYKVEKEGERIIDEEIWSNFRPKAAVVARGVAP